MKLSEEQELALSAALCSAPTKINAWESLIKLTPVLELDGSITRIMPAIYQNLAGSESINGIQKLKGSYLFAWAKNTEFIANMKSLLLLLENSEINYRILKGGALNFLFQSLGNRSMGDIDFLVGKKDLEVFKEILEKAGFRKKFSDACPHIRSGDTDPELNYVNSINIEIDLHIMEDRRPKLLFQLLLETPPVTCEFMGIKIKIPPAELLAMHAIYHGQIGVQASDEIQSVVDVARLIELADPIVLQKLSNILHFDSLLNSYIQVIYKVTGESSLLKMAPGKELIGRIQYSGTQLNELLARLREYPAIRRSRSISATKLLRAFKEFRGHRIAYCFWLSTSKLRQVERVFCLLLGGFLKFPAENVNVVRGASYSDERNHDQVTFSRCSDISQDWRFAFRLDDGTKKVKITMHSQSFMAQSFLVFMNGMVLGVTDRNVDGIYSAEILRPANRIEISFRLPMNGCEECAKKLQDLSIDFG